MKKVGLLALFLPPKTVGFRGMVMHVLAAGDRFDLKKRKAVR
jgi:hypothetical protein